MEKAILCVLLIEVLVLGYLLGVGIIPSYVSIPLSVIIGFAFVSLLKTMD